MKLKVKLATALCAFGICAISGAAHATSVTPPGERVGFDLASPLPQGVYFVDVLSIGNWRNGPQNADSALDYNVPVAIWSTPWDILGGHVQLVGSTPEFLLGFNHLDGAVGGPASKTGFFIQGMYNPFVAGQLAWNLGHGFSVSALVGAYLPVSGGDAGNLLNRATIHEQLALAYHNGGWNLTANLYGGEIQDQNSCSPIAPGVSAAFPLGTTCANNNYFNYDLAVTHTFGKWEFGVVGFGSTDWNVPSLPNPTAFLGVVYPKAQAQFAVGGLMGYNFGPVIMQLVVATDVWTQNYTVKETQGLLHVIVPVWHPEVPQAVIAKY